MQCPECETATSPTARFCRRCGTALPTDADGPEGAAVRAEEAPAVASEDRPDAAGERDTSVLATSRSGGGATRDCPACGAPNSPRRELCGRCGADLETGVSPPRAQDTDAPAPPRTSRSPQRHPRPPGWLVVGAGAVVVAGVLGGLALAGLGPFAPGSDLPEATFAADVYGERAAELPLSDIAAATAHESGGGEDYGARRMVDGDPATAWNNDGDVNEHGVGERIDLYLADPAWVGRIVVDNGFQRDAEAYADNARISRAELVLDGGQRYSVRLDDLGLQRQAIELPEPQLTTTVRLEVTEVFEGDTYQDLAVSEIVLEGWTARGEDLVVAETRADRRRAVPPPR